MVQAARGTHDILSNDCRRKHHVIGIFRQLSDHYGYGEIQTPLFEFADVFNRLGETSDVVTKETYTFTDRGGDQLTLRPEGTAGVVRAVISGGMTADLPLRLWYTGPMFRYERPQKGRYRQFDQLGVELFSPAHPHADVEVIALAHDLLKTLGLNNITLKINTLGTTDDREKYRAALVSYFQDYKNDLSPDSQDRLTRNPLRILDSKDPRDRALIQKAPTFNGYLCQKSVDFFGRVLEGLDSLSIQYVHDMNLVRGLDYYTHTAFEFVSNDLGAQGTVLAGGRYDTLVEQMGGPHLPGVGFAAGVERLLLLSDYVPPTRVPIAFVPLGDAAERRGVSVCYDLRAAGLTVEQGFSGNLQKRMKRADRAGAIIALILGDDELDQGMIVMRDLKTGDQRLVPLDQLVAVCLNAVKQ